MGGCDSRQIQNPSGHSLWTSAGLIPQLHRRGGRVRLQIRASQGGASVSEPWERCEGRLARSRCVSVAHTPCSTAFRSRRGSWQHVPPSVCGETALTLPPIREMTYPENPVKHPGTDSHLPLC